MSVKDINNYDVLKSSLPFIGFVTSVDSARDTVTLNDGKREMTFMPGRLEHATPEEAQALAAAIEAHKTEALKPAKSKKKVVARTSEDYYAGLKRFEDTLARISPEAEASFKAVWAEIMEIVGDTPGKSWDIRWRSKNHSCPVLKVRRKGTNDRAIYCYLLAAEGLRLEISKDFLPPEYEHLFPLRDKTPSTTYAVKMDYAAFTREKQRYYAVIGRIHSEEYKVGE